MIAVEADTRRAELVRLTSEWSTCQSCRLCESRTTVVVGDGNPHAELMFVGEAPGFHEDQRGLPFVGQAGALLDSLLQGIGMTRADCYIANVLKCRRRRTATRCPTRSRPARASSTARSS
jgi:DNA polymerase